MLELKGKRVTVMGLGRFGGGVGVARWLAAQGARVLVTDRDSAEQLEASVAQLRSEIGAGSITLRLGGHDERDFRETDVVVANPAVPTPWTNVYLKAAQAAGVPVTTEIGLMLERLPSKRSRTIGITGSVGKSTTSAMIHHALKAVLGPMGTPVVMGGNIGGSLLGEMGPGGSLNDEAYVVLELSSFMLHWIEQSGAKWSPGVAVVTNIAPNHLDWHGDMGHYTGSKQHLIRHQRRGDTAVLGASVASWAALTPARVLSVDPAQFPGALSVPGAHNRVNAAAALMACVAAAPHVDPVLLARAIRAFPGLEHRLQMVARLDLGAGRERVTFFNDSKSTTPEATVTAVEAVAETLDAGHAGVHLIAGGYDKGSDLSAISSLVGRLGGVYTIGATGPAIARGAGAAAGMCGVGGVGGRVIECGTLAKAVSACVERAGAGHAVLLSPGCASWDQYTNFEARGAEFVALARAMQGAGTAAAGEQA